MSETGSCLCGACSFTAEPAADAGVCHCEMCRKWAGGVFVVTDCGSSVDFAEGAPLLRYRSSDWAERISCATCGSSLMFRMLDGSHHYVSIQCFDDPGRFALASEIFIDRKPACYALAGERPRMTEAEFMATIMPGGANG